VPTADVVTPAFVWPPSPSPARTAEADQLQSSALAKEKRRSKRLLRQKAYSRSHQIFKTPGDLLRQKTKHQQQLLTSPEDRLFNTER